LWVDSRSNQDTLKKSKPNKQLILKLRRYKMKQKSQIKTEIIAGITTFFTMSYIVIVNPSILSTPGTGMPFSGVMTATVCLSFLMTLLMGVYAKLPFAVAPGMGINAFFTFTIILKNQVPWPTALGIVFWSGILFLICSLTPIRAQIASAIPANLRLAAATGIGLFLTFIGLKNSNIVVSDPITFVKLGALGQSSLFICAGMIFMLFLMRKKNPFAFLAGMILITALEYLAGWIHPPESWVSMPDFTSVFFKLDLVGSLKLAFLPSMLSILFTDLFDSISTFMGCAQAVGLKDKKGDPKNLREGLIVDAWATLGAGLMGTSAGTAYLESAAGMEVGGRTGLTAITTALCFLPCLFLSPLASIIPGHATAPVLILVGAMMFRSVSELKLSKLEDLIPAFLTIVLIPLTFSITQGILWGIISHVLLYLIAGRRKELTPSLCVLSMISVSLLIIETQMMMAK
jgi:AGZA family xanthine/uracil permease-like MFS transporter